MFDGSAVRLVTMSSTSGVSVGGNVITLSVANFDVSGKSTDLYRVKFGDFLGEVVSFDYDQGARVAYVEMRTPVFSALGTLSCSLYNATSSDDVVLSFDFEVQTL